MARRPKGLGFTFPPPPKDLSELREVPELALRFPEANTPRQNERNLAYCQNRRRHNYVRSVSHSLKRKIGEAGDRFWRVEETTVWCWDCGIQCDGRHLRDVEVSEAEYQALRAGKVKFEDVNP